MAPQMNNKCKNSPNYRGVVESGAPEGEVLGKMQFLNMCIKESLRLHPPVGGINRRSAQPVVLPDGKVIPTDSQIGVSLHAVMHNPLVWENPYVYDPYRFHPDSISSKHPYAYIPFSAGSRNCIGQNFALTEIRVSVVITLRRFRLSLDEDKPLEMCRNILLKTKSGMWLKIKEL